MLIFVIVVEMTDLKLIALVLKDLKIECSLISSLFAFILVRIFSFITYIVKSKSVLFFLLLRFFSVFYLSNDFKNKKNVIKTHTSLFESSIVEKLKVRGSTKSKQNFREAEKSK